MENHTATLEALAASAESAPWTGHDGAGVPEHTSRKVVNGHMVRVVAKAWGTVEGLSTYFEVDRSTQPLSLTEAAEVVAAGEA